MRTIKPTPLSWPHFGHAEMVIHLKRKTCYGAKLLIVEPLVCYDVTLDTKKRAARTERSGVRDKAQSNVGNSKSALLPVVISSLDPLMCAISMLEKEGDQRTECRMARTVKAGIGCNRAQATEGAK